MLTLICGSAVARARDMILSTPVDKTVLFVAPDHLTVRSIAGQLNGQVFNDQSVTDIETIVELLTGPESARGQWLRSGFELVVLRNIIESDPGSFDYLVGRNSVPRLTRGVLARIQASLSAVEHAVAEEGDFVSPRERQLRLLGRRLEERLVTSGYKLERYARMEALAAVSPDKWKQYYPDVERVVFLDFLFVDETTFYLVNLVRRCVKSCDVLLDFDPETGQTNLEGAYQKFYEAADRLVIDELDLHEIWGDVADENSRNTVVVKADNVEQEIRDCAQVVHRLLSGGKPEELPSVVIALASMEEYAAGLEKELTAFNMDFVWHQSSSPVENGYWVLLERIRDAALRRTTGAAVSALWRGPGFSRLFDNFLTDVEGWSFASRLDYILTLTGELKGWKSLRESVRLFVTRLHVDRKKLGQLTEEEVEMDMRLLSLLELTSKYIAQFSGTNAVSAWGKITGETLKRLGLSMELKASIGLEIIKDYNGQMTLLGNLISPADVSFGNYIALLKTVLNGVTENNDEQLLTKPVTICSPAVAARLQSHCCLILGCNDGNFPKFAKPDASFLGASTPTNQAVYRKAQRIVLNKIRQKHHRVLLWMPERAGVEEKLPSQFLEELMETGEAGVLTAEDLITSMGGRTEAERNKAVQGFVNDLCGLALDSEDVEKFERIDSTAGNIAHGISLLTRRKDRELGEYDGIITDPVLKRWLASWADRHIYSVSQLDTIVGCSFRFFADRMLNLEELEETDDLLPAHTFGSFTHDVLARFYRSWVLEGRGVPRYEEEARARQRLYEAYTFEHDKSHDLSDFARDLMTLKLFGDLQPEDFASGSSHLKEVNDPGVFGQFLLMEMKRGSESGFDFLKPSNFEVGFGVGLMTDDDPLTRAEYLNLDLGQGEVIKLRGRIDRIDISPTGAFAVTDYKTGKIPEKRDILGGYRTQLPVYILVGSQLLKGQYENPDPAGGLYYSLKRGDDVKVSGVFFRAAYQKDAGIEGRCLKDDEFQATLQRVKGFMRHSIRAVRQGYLTTTWRDPDNVCRFCSFEGLCYKNVERTEAFWTKINEENSTEAT